MNQSAFSAIRTPLVAFLFSIAACASGPSVSNEIGDSRALLNATSSLRSVLVMEIGSRDTLYRFTPSQIDSLKSALKASFISESLLLTTPPWNIALVMESNSGQRFITLHYGDVLRMNARDPWSTSIADSSGNAPAPGITDIVLGGDEVPWLFELLEKAVGKPASKTHSVPKMPPQMDVE